jgi:hypothetical protein
MSLEGIMENPWLTLPDEAPYCLASDSRLLHEFNSAANDATRIHLEIMPEPFLGRPESKVVLLNLNPGFSDEEQQYHDLDQYFRNATLDNLAYRPQPYPFYFLDPTVQSPGHVWWRSRLRSLIERFSAEQLAQDLLCVEYFPYHSRRYDRRVPFVASQEYGFDIVRHAIQRGAVILTMRAAALWLAAVPELAEGNTYRLNSSQSVYVTMANCPAGYSAIVDALSR